MRLGSLQTLQLLFVQIGLKEGWGREERKRGMGPREGGGPQTECMANFYRTKDFLAALTDLQ